MTIAAQKLTFAAYLTYNDGLGTRFELVQGELRPMSLGTGKHGKIIKFIDDQLNAEIDRLGWAWTSQRLIVGVQSPRGNRWDTCRIPDITVLPIAQWDAMEDRESVIRAHEPPPKLVVEVVSPSTATDDYRSKRTEYAVLDIVEYWIVDAIAGLITICTLKDGAYDDQVFRGDQLIESATFPALIGTATQILNAG
jgi:Uma2 family endonuclease